MNTTTKAVAPHAWEDFDADLDESMVTVASPEETAAVEEALGLQMISIRLQKSLIESLKLIAHHHSVGYQPLIRDLLNRFAASELKNILHLLAKQKEEQTKLKAISEFLEREAELARKRA